jgi:ATP-dependent exoDNAse (exonuclease V) alpha subunit
VDAERAGQGLVNQRLAYVAVSRGRYDAQIYSHHDATQYANRLPDHRFAGLVDDRTAKRRVLPQSDRAIPRPS